MKKLDINNCFRSIPPAIDYVLPGMIHGTVGAIISPGASGKSFLALQLGIQISSGADVLGWERPLNSGEVLLLAGEDPEVALHARLHELGKQLSSSQREAVANKFTIYPLVGELELPDLMAPVSEQGLIEIARGKRLIIIDTLRRFHSGNENDSGNMSRVIKAMEYLANITGASVIFLHHSSKSAALGGTVDEQQSSRGSSVLTDNVRWQAYLSTMSKSEAKDNKVNEASRRYYVRFGVSKQNYGPQFDDVWLERVQGGVLKIKTFSTDECNNAWRFKNGH